MANRNTNPGIGETTDSGVMHNPQPSRACVRTRTREGSSAADCRSAGGQSWRESVRTRDDANFSAWRVKTFGGNFDPVRKAVEDAVAEFSDRQPARDRSLWLKIANEIGYEAFRDLYLEQLSIMRECKLRNPSAAFQNRLNRYTQHSPAGASRGSGHSPVRSSEKGGVA